MLRRKPTAISITNEDVASYEDRQNAAAEELRAEMQRAAQMQAQKGQNVNPNDGHKTNPIRCYQRALDALLHVT
ncbi:hypothetical protein VC83_06417 [Pseudogymnoascus destructans]|uniref:Anaphase-promoting complex subunit CDC26 n=1 Tax=Pseudogymnoascus destructans TaxID=655981 RepID=A0A177AB14_9PEZI|nr:uncharacterized protein VC83_06417 [Pseudogymnoascus destructans]OAF58373.1 hypothetical protein VC83_06417 [Pseudogymnoascus destructans]